MSSKDAEIKMKLDVLEEFNALNIWVDNEIKNMQNNINTNLSVKINSLPKLVSLRCKEKKLNEVYQITINSNI